MSARDNKFNRNAKQQAARPQGRAFDAVQRDLPPQVDEQLSRLEEDIRRLKIEYDIYFNNATRRPPFDTRSRVETTIKRLADDRTFTFAQRFRYNSLVARFTAMREMWRRTMQDREEGRDAASLARAAHAERRAAKPQPSATFVCADARTDVETVRELYGALVAAKKQCGEMTDDFSFPRFHRLIAAKTEALRSQLSCEQVRYMITVDDGRVVFKAKAE